MTAAKSSLMSGAGVLISVSGGAECPYLELDDLGGIGQHTKE
jgi:hypothetical protein